MAGLNNRPNVSKWIAELNVVQPENDNSLGQDNFNIDEELNLFTNTEFFENNSPFDATPMDQSMLSYSPAQQQTPGQANPLSKKEYSHGLEDSNAYQYPNMTDLMTSDAVSPVTNTSAYPAYEHSGLPEHYGAPNVNFDPSAYSLPATHASPSSFSQTPQSHKQEEDAKAAAEEDKRRRNTAASARFRVKKKQREQALEKSQKELMDRLAAAEKKVKELEKENALLRSLFPGQNGKDGSKAQQFRSSEVSDEGERSPKETRKGVGTKSAGRA